MMILSLISRPALHRTRGQRTSNSNHGNQTPQVFAQNEEGYIAVEFHLNAIFWLPYEFRFSRKQSISRVNRSFIKCRNCALCQGKWCSIRQIFSGNMVFHKTDIFKTFTKKKQTELSQLKIFLGKEQRKGFSYYWAGEINSEKRTVILEWRNL